MENNLINKGFWLAIFVGVILIVVGLTVTFTMPNANGVAYITAGIADLTALASFMIGRSSKE